MVVLFNISFNSSNGLLSVTSYYPPLRVLCNIKLREGSYYRVERWSPNTFSLMVEPIVHPITKGTDDEELPESELIKGAVAGLTGNSLT